MDSTLAELAAKEAIRELVLLFCRACDRGDVSLLRELFTADAIDEHGFNASNTAQEFLDSVVALQQGIECSQHHITNHVIRVKDNRAEGEAYTLAYYRFASSSGQSRGIVFGGRYLDRYVLDRGEWRFSHRKSICDWRHEFEAPAPAPRRGLITGPLPCGSMDGQDPSTDFFSLIRRGSRNAANVA